MPKTAFKPSQIPTAKSSARQARGFLTPEQIDQVRTHPAKMLSILEAAAYLNVGRLSVCKLIEMGQINARKLGRRIIVTRDSIDEYMSGGAA